MPRPARKGRACTAGSRDIGKAVPTCAPLYAGTSAPCCIEKASWTCLPTRSKARSTVSQPALDVSSLWPSFCTLAKSSVRRLAATSRIARHPAAQIAAALSCHHTVSVTASTTLLRTIAAPTHRLRRARQSQPASARLQSQLVATQFAWRHHLKALLPPAIRNTTRTSAVHSSSLEAPRHQRGTTQHRTFRCRDRASGARHRRLPAARGRAAGAVAAAEQQEGRHGWPRQVPHHVLLPHAPAEHPLRDAAPRHRAQVDRAGAWYLLAHLCCACGHCGALVRL